MIGEGHGLAALASVVPMDLIERMRADLETALAICRSIQEKAGLPNTAGTVHHLPVLHRACPSFLEFLDTNPVAPYISEFFDGKPYILQSMGGNFNFPGGGNYASQVHRDIRSYFSDRMMLNTLVALDDLTPENGTTLLLPGGHRLPDKPDNDTFTAKEIRICMPAGSIIMWDSRLWHRAGVNRTDKPRRIVTPIFTRPFFKQGFDYPRAIGDKEMSENLRQVLGYNARVPATLEEWYAPPERRAYRGDQG
jgi:ectoine hydroxylase-related dioxygenase (phytanoyl-CoA dioxygenase family)